MSECPEEFVCFTEQEWIDFLLEYEVEIIDEVGGLPVAPTSDAQALSDFTWEILFLSPWELAYIALPMSVLAFYGLTIYALFKKIQKRYQ
tara:strand:+ start:1447 stop:1716 length:270 start_codon:yes stop_codon:yes gene_type:complete